MTGQNILDRTDRTGQDRTWLDRIYRTEQTGQDSTWHDRTDRTEQNRTEQTGQDKTRQDKTRQSWTGIEGHKKGHNKIEYKELTNKKNDKNVMTNKSMKIWFYNIFIINSGL